MRREIITFLAIMWIELQMWFTRDRRKLNRLARRARDLSH